MRAATDRTDHRRRRQPRAVLALLWAVIAACFGLGLSSLRAESVVIVTDGRVAQYREATTAAREVLTSAPLLDVASADLAAQIGQHRPSVILAVGQKALTSAQGAAPELPVVYCLVLGASAPSTKTVTGVRLEVSAADQLALLRLVHPKMKRIAIIYEPRNWTDYITDATKVAQGMGITLVPRAISDGKQVRAVLGEMLNNVDGLWLLPDPQLITAEMFGFLLVSTLERKVPLFGFFDSFTKAGALASVSPDYGAIGQRAAKLAQSIAQKPEGARTPVPPPLTSPGILTVNQKTAGQLDVELSQDVLGKARQVFR